MPCKSEYFSTAVAEHFSVCRNFKLEHMPHTIAASSANSLMHAPSRAASRGPWNDCAFGAGEQPCTDCAAAIKAEALRNATPKDPFAGKTKKDLIEPYKAAGGKAFKQPTGSWGYPKVEEMKKKIRESMNA